MIGPGFAYKTCDCEDFPCCGHNDVDPDWEPDPYDAEAEFYEDGPLATWKHDPGRDGTACVSCCEVVDEVDVDGWCRECFEPF